jgi:AraC-like DNA-binding protein
MIKSRAFAAVTLCAIFAAFLAAGCGLPGTGPAAVEVSSWEVLYDQAADPAAAASMKGWAPYDTSRLVRTPYAPRRGHQHIWIRGSFSIDGDTAPYFGIIPGRIYHTDETYVNGVPVGFHDEAESASLHYPRSYPIPRGALVRGSNTLMMRIGIYGREFGGITNRVMVLGRDDYFSRKKLLDLVYRQIPTGIIIFLLGQVLFIAILYAVRRRKDSEYVYSAALCLLWAVYIYSIFAPWYPASNDVRISLLWGLGAFISICFLMLVQSYYKLYFFYINAVLLPVMTIIGAVTLIFNDTTSPWYPARILNVGVVNFMVVFMVYLLYMIYRMRRDNLFYISMVFGILPGLCVAWDVTNYLWINHHPPVLQTYTIPVHAVGVMIVIITNIMRRDSELEVLYSRLKPREGDERVTTITSGTEEKLERVIAFLRENFRSDISREGLAGAMDMSVDHMSRMFKAYTGKKINEYLNELRIREAVRLLDASDSKIIEIAFDVGFESLATFNRVFLKVVGTTPTEYKRRSA